MIKKYCNEFNIQNYDGLGELYPSLFMSITMERHVSSKLCQPKERTKIHIKVKHG